MAAALGQADLAHMGIAGRLNAGGCFSAGPSVTGTLPAEAHAMLNKKIAQLTKVIISINERNEDSDYRLQCVQFDHDQDLEKLRRKLSKEREETEKSLVAACTEVSELRAQGEENCRHRTQADDAVATAKREQASVQLALEQAQHALEKEQKGRKECDAAHADAERKWRHQVSQLEMTQTRTVRELTGKYEREAQQLKQDLDDARQQNAKLGSESNAKMAEEMQKFSCRHLQELSRVSKELEDEKIQHRSATSRLQATVTELEEKISALLRQRDELQAKLSDTANVATATAERLQADCGRLRAELGEAVKQRDSVRKELDSLCASQASKTSTTAEMQRQWDTDKDRLAAVQGERTELSRQLTIMEQRCDGLESDAKRKAAGFGKLQAECVQLRSVVASQNQELAKVNSHCLQLQRDKAALLSEHGVSDQQRGARVGELESEIRKLTAYQEKMRAKYAREIETLQSKMGQETDILRQQHAGNTAELRTKHRDQLKHREEELTAQHGEQLRTAKERLASDWEKQRRELEAKLTSERASVTRLHDDMAVLKHELEELRKKVKEHTAGLGSASEELSAMRRKESALGEELAGAVAKQRATVQQLTALQSEMVSLKSKHASALKSAQDGHASKMSAMQKKVEHQWKEKLRAESEHLRGKLSGEHASMQQSSLEHMSETLAEQLSALRQEHSQAQTTLKSEIEQLRKEMEDTRREVSDKTSACGELEKKNEELRLELERLQALMRTRLADVTRRQQGVQAELNATIDKLQVELDRLRNEHSQQLTEMREAELVAAKVLREDKERSVADTLAQAVARQQEQLDELRRQLKLEEEDSLRHQDIDYQKRLLAERRQTDVQRQLLETRMADVTRRLQDAQKEVDDFQEKVAQQTAALSTATLSAEEQAKEIEMLRSSSLEQQEEASAKLRQLHDCLLEEHTDQVNRLKLQFSTSMELVSSKVNANEEAWQKRTKELEQGLRAAREQYEHRSPRQQDTAAIDSLQGENTQIHETIARLQKQLMAAALQIKHRDDMINKVYMGASKLPISMKVADDPLWFMPKKTKPNGSGGSNSTSKPLPPIGPRRASAPHMQPKASSRTAAAAAAALNREDKMKSRSSTVLAATAMQMQLSSQLASAEASDIARQQQQLLHLQNGARQHKPPQLAWQRSGDPSGGLMSHRRQQQRQIAFAKGKSHSDPCSEMAIELPDVQRTTPLSRLSALPNAPLPRVGNSSMTASADNTPGRSPGKTAGDGYGTGKLQPISPAKKPTASFFT